MGYKIVIYLLIATLVLPPTEGWLYTIGAGIAGIVAAPIVAPVALGALGFGAGGIAAGAAGIGLMGKVVLGAAGAAAGAMYEKTKCEDGG